jgi:CheY-like chemotaxis protein
MKEERERTVESGFTDYLTKPIDRSALANTILKFQSRI